MGGIGGGLGWANVRWWLLARWQSRVARYTALLIFGLGLIGSELPFEPYDWVQKSLTARVNAKPYRGDAIVVEIDARTMEALGKSRISDDDLALLIDRIAAAKPKQIVIGRIRQHLPTQQSSQKLVDAIKRVSPKPVMFVELTPRKPFEFSWSNLDPEKSDDDFLPPKLDLPVTGLVEPASEVSSSSSLGAPWGLPPTIRNNGVAYRSMAQLMADKTGPLYEKYEIDFSYDPASIPYVAMIDVLSGDSENRKFAGRRVFISSTSRSPRDAIVTPHGPFASSAAISIFGAQTLIDGPPLMVGWLPTYSVAVLAIFAWLNLRPLYGRTIFVLAFVGIALSPLILERHLVFQQTSNAVFLMIIVALGRQWSKFRATLALARSAAETKSWFLAQASHDLRQPIHAIGMLSARLAQSELTPAQAELASKIDRSIEGANRMLQSLLDLATIESGSLKPNIAPIAVNALLAEVEEQSALAAERAGVSLRFVPSEAAVLTDRSLAVAMLQNIVSNAIKYATGKKVLVGARRSGNQLSLCVYDLGAGISKEDMRHVQKAFFRASNHRKGSVEGTGLGLAIVHRLASLLGLNFILRSTSGKGTAAIIGGFRLTNAAPVSAVTTQSNIMRPLTGLRILLVDDDVASLRATEALLVQWGCSVGAFDMFPDTKEHYDIILSDFDFGKGRTLADHRERIDSLSREGVTTIVMSGHHPDAVKSAMKRETLVILAKPVRPAELRSVLMASKSAAMHSA